MAVARLVDTPHFALPLRYVNGSAVVNQQDTMDDITSCVLAICLTTPGDRDEMPDFGIEDPTFGAQQIPLAAIVAQIENWEPRATILATQAPDRLDGAIVNANLDVVVVR
jgi:phage baseplate assembly protein W